MDKLNIYLSQDIDNLDYLFRGSSKKIRYETITIAKDMYQKRKEIQENKTNINFFITIN